MINEELCYLGYWFKYNARQELNIRRRVERTGKVMKQAYRERRFRDEWKT